MSTVPDNVLSRVTMVGAETAIDTRDTVPLWVAELNTTYSGPGERPVVVKRPALSTLLERDADDEVKVGTLGSARVRMRQPVLMRAHVAAKGDQASLRLWSVERKQYHEGSLLPLAEIDDHVAVLAPRAERWPNQPASWSDKAHAWVPEIGVPPLRLVEGRIALGLVVNAQPLSKLLQLADSSSQSTILGGLKVDLLRVKGQKVLPIGLTPQGIEFEAWLPDPTSDFTETPQGDGTIQVVVRLEDDGNGGRCLRFVGCKEQSTLDNLERRLASALANLGAGDSPLSVRFDVRPLVPPISWRLKVANALSSLAFDGQWVNDTAGPRWKSWHARLDPAGLDLRVVTRQKDPQPMSDVAQIGVRGVMLSRVPEADKGKATLSLHINSAPTDDLSTHGPQAELVFTRVGTAWTTRSTFNGGRPAAVSIDLDLPLQRLDPLNRAAKLIEAKQHTPSLFLLMRHGWLQAKVPEGRDSDAPAQATSLAHGSLTGRLVAGPVTGRSIAIESAAHATVTAEWAVDFNAKDIPKVTHVLLNTWGTQGRLSGYLFCSAATPSEEEVLPTLRGGSATLRDLRIDFGAPRRRGRWWSGFMAIEEAKANSAWRLDLDLPAASGWTAWLHEARRPVIPTMALTRAASSSGRPSVSRDLLPLDLLSNGQPGKLVLKTDDTSSLPLVGWHGEARWAPDSLKPTLLMPTLLGIELQPSDGPLLAPLLGKDNPKPLLLKLQARMRMDLPQLDELMASVQIPRKPAETAPTSVKTTALQRDLLKISWQKAHDRLALSIADGVVATTAWANTLLDVPGTTAAPSPPPVTEISHLVEPFIWRTPFGVSTSLRYSGLKGLPANLPLGSYALAGEKYALEQTALGMGTADQPVGFKVSDDHNEIKTSDTDPPIKVTGLAAALYQDHDAHFDSRGFGLRPRAEVRSGLSMRGALTRKHGEAPAQHWLVTLMQTLRIEDKDKAPLAPKLGLFVRDLPMQKDQNGTLAFEGKDNDSESLPGTDGSAFSPHQLPFNLHEWRLFELNEQGNTTGLYTLHWGPLAFTPLRLWHLTLIEDSNGTTPKLGALEVIGKLSIAEGPEAWPPQVSAGLPEPHGPYGPDEVYQPGDLFKLTIDQAFKFTLSAVDVEPDSATHRLSFKARPGGMVDIRTRATLTGHPGADVPISLKLMPEKGGNAELHARLFGFERALKGKVKAFSDSLIEVQLEAPPAPTACLRVDGITVTLSKEQAVWKAALGVDVAIALRNEANEALFERRADGNWRWLNLPWQQERDGALKIDHTTGRVEWLVDQAFQPKALRPQLEPLAGLATAAFTVRGVVAMAAPQQLPQAWPHFEPGSTALHVEIEGREAPVTPRAPEWLTGLGIRHTFGAESTSKQKQHTLHVDWTATQESRIRWPVDSVSFAQPNSGGNLKKWVQLMNIAATAQAHTHTVTLALREHELPSAVLGRLPGAEKPPRYGFVKPWRFLATTRHRLGNTKGTNNAIEWTSLDHVAVMPASALLLPKDDPYVYAARYRKGLYRTKADPAANSPPDMAHAGVGRRTIAEAGFADEHLQAAFSAQGIGRRWDPVMVGGSPTLFAEGNAKEQLAVVPWFVALGHDDGDLPRLDQCGTNTNLQWRIALADSLAAKPVVTRRDVVPVSLSAATSSARIEHDLRESLGIKGQEQATLNHLPVEQAYFELFDEAKGQAIPMDGQPASAVPYFPLALAVLQAVWQRRGKPLVATGLLASTGLQSKAVRVQVRFEEAVLAEEGPSMVPVDLWVVSREAVHAMPEIATMLRASGSGSEAVSKHQQLARLRDLATRGSHEPVAIIVRVQRSANPAEGHLFASVDPLPAIDDFGAPARGGPKHCVPPSPAFGWPSAHQTETLGKLTLTVRGESPVLSQAAGLAGRGLALDLPAWAAPAWSSGKAGPEALYLSFAEHVVFQRPEAVLFRGPAARHLVPVPTRLRAPLCEQQLGALAMLASGNSVAECAPILPPRVERTTIGNRPGVFQAMSASVVVPAEEQGFDEAQPGSTRPASSGPVIVHQLRAPRSPALPDDQDLALRRRTFISEADTTPLPDEQKRYASFCALDQPAEIFRAQNNGDWRFTLVQSPRDALLSPQWDGRLAITLESRTAPSADQTTVTDAKAEAALKAVGLLPTTDAVTLCVNLRIGAVAFPFEGYAWDEPKTEGHISTRQCTFTMTKELAGALLRLAEAPADTPITLELQATPQAKQAPVAPTGTLAPQKSAVLAAGPPRHLTLPLLRAPGNRPTPPVSTVTVAFGDPAYDRQLGSKTLFSTPDYHAKQEFVLILDRDKYDLGSTVHLAGGLVDSTSRLFDKQNGKLELQIYQIPAADVASDTPVEGKQLGDSHAISDGKAYALKLSSLLDENDNAARLAPGDRLVFKLSAPDGLGTTKPKPRELVVQLTEEATIAPPPSVYSLLAIRDGMNPEDEPSARIPLHACAPLPTRIEFPDLLNDLAKGYVRRRGLFVWSWSRTEQGLAKLALLKIDRSGGVQLPRTVDDFVQV